METLPSQARANSPMGLQISIRKWLTYQQKSSILPRKNGIPIDCSYCSLLPSGYLTSPWKFHYKWWFIAGKIIYKWAIYTMAMLVITRGYIDMLLAKELIAILPGWCFHPLWKIWDTVMMTFPIYGNIKHVPKHRPVTDSNYILSSTFGDFT